MCGGIYINYQVLGSAVDKLFLPSLKFYSSSKMCTAMHTCLLLVLHVHGYIIKKGQCSFLPKDDKRL